MSSRGFTLIETLLALTLFALVSAGSYNVFNMGIQIWKRTEGRSDVERKITLVMEKMGREIRSTPFTAAREEEFEIQESPYKIDFKGNSLSFSLPAVVEIMNKKNEFMMQVGRLTYQWDSKTKELCRMQEGVTDIYQNRTPPCLKVAAGIERLRFQYWLKNEMGTSYSWFDEWDISEGLPTGIRVEMEIETKLKGEKQSSRKKIQKTFLIKVEPEQEDSTLPLGENEVDKTDAGV